MAKIEIKNISFPVEKIEIIRTVQYAMPEDGVIYLPEGVELYQIPDTSRVAKFDGKEYIFNDYVGVTVWSEEKERISHSMQIIVDNESTDYPVVNSLCLTAYNLFDEVLIYYIKGAVPKPGNIIPLISYVPSLFNKEIYFKKIIGDEDVMNSIIDYINNTSKCNYSVDKITELSSKLERPYAYYKVQGLVINGDEPMLDVTIVQTDSEFKCANDIKSITRTGIELGDIEEKTFSDMVRRVKKINYIEYSKAYNDTIKQIY